MTGALVWDRPGDGDFQAVDTSASFVYTGGHFSTVAGQMRGHLAAFDQQTGAIQPWAPTISGVHGVLDLQVTAGLDPRGGAVRQGDQCRCRRLRPLRLRRPTARRHADDDDDERPAGHGTRRNDADHGPR